MSEPWLLGIDIGSSAVKAAVFALDGRQQAAARVACDSTAEIDPERWWAAVVEVLARLPGTPVAVGVCGRGGTGVLLDSEGRVLGPSWSDGRATGVAADIRRSRPELSPQSVGLLSKAVWWERRRGERVALALTAKDFVTARLTGQTTSDPASGGLAASPGPLPAAEPPWSLNGRARGSGPLPAGTPVAVGWHDGAAAAFGAGAATEGAAPVTLGTTAVYRVVTRRLPPGLRKYWDLTPGLTVTGGDIVGAGRAYAWAARVLADADASGSSIGAAGVTFLPQLSGRIAPDRDLSARGTWWGLDGTQTSGDLLRAVVEGTAFSLRQVRDWLAAHGLRAERVVATGGGSRNLVQVRALADALRAPVATANIEEGCRGAALLGGIAAGLLDIEEARRMSPAYTVVEPEPANAPAYGEAYARFLAVQAATGGAARAGAP